MAEYNAWVAVLVLHNGDIIVPLPLSQSLESRVKNA